MQAVDWGPEEDSYELGVAAVLVVGDAGGGVGVELKYNYTYVNAIPTKQICSNRKVSVWQQGTGTKKHLRLGLIRGLGILFFFSLQEPLYLGKKSTR